MMFGAGNIGIPSDGSLKTLFTGTGILMLIGVLIFLVIKHKVVRLVAIDEGTEWVRAKWDVSQRYRTNWFGHTKGRIVRLKPGRALLIRGIYDGWQVSLKEVPLSFENFEASCQGRMLKFDRVTIGYRIYGKDSPKGDEAMLRSILSVRNPSRLDQSSPLLDDKVLAIVMNTFGDYLREEAQVDRYGLPYVDKEAIQPRVKDDLFKQHGVKLTSFLTTSPTWLQGQQQLDAARLIASAMGLKQDESRSDPTANSETSSVVVLPVTNPA